MSIEELMQYNGEQEILGKESCLNENTIIAPN